MYLSLCGIDESLIAEWIVGMLGMAQPVYVATGYVLMVGENELAGGQVGTLDDVVLSMLCQ